MVCCLLDCFARVFYPLCSGLHHMTNIEFTKMSTIPLFVILDEGAGERGSASGGRRSFGTWTPERGVGKQMPRRPVSPWPATFDAPLWVPPITAVTKKKQRKKLSMQKSVTSLPLSSPAHFKTWHVSRIRGLEPSWFPSNWRFDGDFARGVCHT